MTGMLEDLRPGDRVTAWDIIGFDGAFRDPDTRCTITAPCV